MSVCIDCYDKHPDYRSDFGHLDMDLDTGATILVQHGKSDAVLEAERNTWTLLLATANIARRVAFADMQATVMLEPSGIKAKRLRFYERINTFIPRRSYFTPSWTDEARRAFYAPVRRMNGVDIHA